jgi:hypothetical protein
VAYESREADSDESYDEYFDSIVTQYVETEVDISDASADIRVDLEDWDDLSPKALGEFMTADVDWSEIDSLVLEFETGRSEGAFGFRKIRESLEKYDDGSIDLVAIVVPPPWLVEIDQASTQTVKQLVIQWNRSTDDVVSALFTPTFDSAGCSELDLIAGANSDD